MTDLPLALRPAAESDLGYVKNTMVKSFGDSPWAKSMPWSLYRAGHSALVECLIPRCAVLIACPEDDQDTILGWAATEENTVHYCYVRSKVRKQGIASLLLEPYLKPGRTVYYSHPAAWLKLPEHWQWNPYSIAPAVHQAELAGLPAA